MQNKPRCSWVPADKPDYIAYHDNEWGRPINDDNRYFEMLILEGAQAGLSWYSILKRRPGYRAAFHNFNPQKVAQLTDPQLEKILASANIIRNRLKVFATRKNAQAFLKIQKEFGSFHNYLQTFFTPPNPASKPPTGSKLPTTSPIAVALSKDLKSRGMTFVGPTIIYAFMQATGLVNDHHKPCYLAPK